MAEGFDLTTYYAKRIIGDTAAASAASALLQTGTDIAGDTWILHRDNRTSKLYGIKYAYDATNGHDKIQYYGKNSSDSATAWIQLDTGDASFTGNVTANKFIGPLQGNADTASAANITTTANTLAYYSNTTGAFADTGIKYFSGSAYAGKTYIGWVKFASIDIGTNNYWGNKIYDIFLDRSYNSPASEVYSIRVSAGWGSSHIIQLSGRAGTQIMNKFRVVRDNTTHTAYFEYYVNTSYTTHQNTVNIKILGYHGAAVTLMNAVQTEDDSEFSSKEEISLTSNSIVGNLTGNASTATQVKVTGVSLPSSNNNIYYLTYAGSTTTGNQDIKDSNRLYVYEDTTSTYFNVGSASTSGGITVHNANGKYVDIISSAFGANRTLTLPDATGTICLTSHTHGWANLTDNADSLSEGTSNWTDNTEILTSYASNNGFADTSAKGRVYRRDAVCAYNYIKNKASGSWAINASSATYLKNQGRATDANITHVTDGGMRLYLATSSMASNGPGSDGNILHFHWDKSAAWDAQLHIPDSSASSMHYRGSSTAGTWGAWKTILDSSNYTSYRHSEIITAGDNRAVATTPNTYSNKIIFQGLKTNSSFGSPSTDTYSYVIGLRGWSDSSGGQAHELAFNDSGVYRRQGSTTSWGNWMKVFDAGNNISLVESNTNLKSASNGLSGNADRYLRVVDKNGYDFALFQGVAKTDGSIYAYMGVNNRKTNGTAVGWSGISISQTKTDSTVTYGISNPENFTWSLLHVADPSNLNNAKRMGNFKISNTTTNTPISGMWGATWNIVDDSAIGNNNNAGSTWQLVFKSASNDMWLRNITNEGSWSEYAKFLSDKNYSTYALPLSGGTMTGDITFSATGTTGNANGLKWSGSSDSASIYYSVPEADKGILVLDVEDDANAAIFFSNCGSTKLAIDGSYVWTYAPIYNSAASGTTTSDSTGAVLLCSKIAGNTGIFNGNGDGTGLSGTADLIIKSWYGVGFVDGCTGQGMTIGMNCRTGAIKANSVQGAVWNDYAEYRHGDSVDPGYCYTETKEGIMTKTKERLMPGCKISSDTFGFSIGQTEQSQTPIAVSGRVLAYPYREHTEYHLGDALCSAPNGTVDIMTREEIMMYPERIVGTVSEIPDYDIWQGGRENSGKDPINVNGRIWIYVR